VIAGMEKVSSRFVETYEGNHRSSLFFFSKWTSDTDENDSSFRFVELVGEAIGREH